MGRRYSSKRDSETDTPKSRKTITAIVAAVAALVLLVIVLPPLHRDAGQPQATPASPAAPAANPSAPGQDVVDRVIGQVAPEVSPDASTASTGLPPARIHTPVTRPGAHAANTGGYPANTGVSAPPSDAGVPAPTPQQPFVIWRSNQKPVSADSATIEYRKLKGFSATKVVVRAGVMAWDFNAGPLQKAPVWLQLPAEAAGETGTFSLAQQWSFLGVLQRPMEGGISTVLISVRDRDTHDAMQLSNELRVRCEDSIK